MYFDQKLFLMSTLQGHATAGGCALTLACDYRIMSKGSDKPYVIGLNESKLVSYDKLIIIVN